MQGSITVYTTKSSLAYAIERDFFGIMFAYVAREADPSAPPQDPSSSPERIFRLFCQIARAEDNALTAEDRRMTANHIQTLQEVALRLYSVGRIDAATLRRIQIRLSKATHRDIQPLLLRADIAETRLKPGDDKTATGFPNNWERVIDDLRFEEVVVVKDDCD